MTEHDIFIAAIKLTGDSRSAFLSAACGQDAKLREQVEGLLRAHVESGVPPPRDVQRKPEDPRLEATHLSASQAVPGTLIGERYKLLEAIGEGGMGTVWVAEQSQPVKRKVALKLIKPGMDSKSVLARFEAERQALAVMDHPNIAKVLDGGITETGRPYFVMEYVKGIPITEYCDAARLSVPERLQLFAQVCQAVQHAHQKGIIHRDLKPSNILVAPYDDKPVPKVIDFGLAKAMNQSLTEKTLHTAHDTVLGTPLYMSPEQALLNNIDVDTRSDIYSLGVLLYELLTGSTPLEKQRFKQAAWDEVRRIIREEEPPRPSLRLSSAETLPSLAAGRHTEPARLTKLIRGELDWIVMKALEKDRTRRYETANGFAADVQRYLTGEPVLAAPPSARYRLGVFARKHRAALTTATVIFVLLVAGMAGTIFGLIRAEQANRRVERQRDLAQIQRDKARANFRLAREAVDSFHTRVSQSAELKSHGLELLRRDLLNSAADFYQRFVNEEAEDAVVQIEQGLALQRLGELNLALGLSDRADKNYQQALVIFQKLSQADPEEINIQVHLANTYRVIGKLHRLRGRIDAGERAFLAAISISEALAKKHPPAPRTSWALAAAQQELGILYAEIRRNDEAAAAYEQACQGYRQLMHDNATELVYQQDLAATLLDLGVLYVTTNRANLAEAPYNEARELNQRLVDAHPDLPEYADALAVTMLSLSVMYSQSGRNDQAFEANLQALNGYERLVQGHPQVVDFQLSLAQANNNLGVHLRGRSLDDQAEPYYRAACDTLQRLTESYPEVSMYALSLGVARLNTGNLLRDLGKYPDAMESYSRARQGLSGILAKESRHAVANLALTLVHGGEALTLARLGRHADAELAIKAAMKLGLEPPSAELRYDITLVHALADRHRAAVAEAVEVAAAPEVTGREMLGLAAACALSADAAVRDELTPTGERSDLQSQYCLRAIEILRRAEQRGLFRAPAAIDQLRQNPDFAQLHSRDDFNMLVSEMRATLATE